MPKKKIEVEMTSYGIYTQWEREQKQLPKIRKHTKEIPSELDIEFGYILRILRAKGAKITFVMEHPPFCDVQGRVRPDFVGEEMVNSNEWHFFLGDTVWAPIEDKCGEWELITMLDGKEVARMRFNLFNPNI
ncbi:MAG: DUF3859 domain-containing protein [Rikenellaceae bacterium]